MVRKPRGVSLIIKEFCGTTKQNGWYFGQRWGNQEHRQNWQEGGTSEDDLFLLNQVKSNLKKKEKSHRAKNKFDLLCISNLSRCYIE